MTVGASFRASFVVLLLLPILWMAEVGAGEPLCEGELVADPISGQLVCRGDSGGNGGSGGGRGGGGTAPPTTGYPFRELWIPVLIAGPDGTCLDTTTIRLDREPTSAEELQSELQFFRYIRQYPMCPDANPPPATSPSLEAANFLEVIDLPIPRPYIRPGRLPVGFDAYLETGAPTAQTFGPRATPFGDLVLTATAFVFVDWDDPHDGVEGEEGPLVVGDGLDVRPARPGPHPDGEITHLYQHDGFHEVTVRYEWVADWSIGTEHTGTITAVQTSGVYPAPGFEAYSRQAVG